MPQLHGGGGDGHVPLPAQEQPELTQFILTQPGQKPGPPPHVAVPPQVHVEVGHPLLRHRQPGIPPQGQVPPGLATVQKPPKVLPGQPREMQPQFAVHVQLPTPAVPLQEQPVMGQMLPPQLQVGGGGKQLPVQTQVLLREQVVVLAQPHGGGG